MEQSPVNWFQWLLFVGFIWMSMDFWFRFLWKPERFIRFNQEEGRMESNAWFLWNRKLDTIVGIQLIFGFSRFSRLEKSRYLLNLILTDSTSQPINPQHVQTEAIVSFEEIDEVREAGKQLAYFLKVPLIDQTGVA
jgi:hypothetical protein